MMALAEPDQDGAANRRRTGRAMLAFPGKLALSDGNFDCIVEDLSLGGARITCFRAITPDREAWLKFDRFKVFGTINWRDGNEYGVAFEEALPKRVILEMRDHAADISGYERRQATLAAKDHVIGDGPVGRSRFLRMLDVLGPIDRTSYSACPQCEGGKPCATHCGQKQLRRAKKLRIAALLALAAAIGAAAGIGSVLLA